MVTKMEQKQRLDEKIARRKQLIAERESKGLSTDEAVLDSIQDQEEAEKGEHEGEKRVSKRGNLFEGIEKWVSKLGFLLEGIEKWVSKMEE